MPCLSLWSVAFVVLGIKCRVTHKLGKCSAMESQPQPAPILLSRHSSLPHLSTPALLHFLLISIPVPQIGQIIKARDCSSPFYSKVDWQSPGVVQTFSWQETGRCACVSRFSLPPYRSSSVPSWGSTLMILWDPEFLLKTLALKTIVRLRPSRLSPHNEENLYSNHSNDHCCGSFNNHCRHKSSLEWKKCLLGRWSLCNPISHQRLCR